MNRCRWRCVAACLGPSVLPFTRWTGLKCRRSAAVIVLFTLAHGISDMQPKMVLAQGPIAHYRAGVEFGDVGATYTFGGGSHGLELIFVPGKILVSMAYDLMHSQHTGVELGIDGGVARWTEGNKSIYAEVRPVAGRYSIYSFESHHSPGIGRNTTYARYTLAGDGNSCSISNVEAWKVTDGRTFPRKPVIKATCEVVRRR